MWKTGPIAPVSHFNGLAIPAAFLHHSLMNGSMFCLFLAVALAVGIAPSAQAEPDPTEIESLAGFLSGNFILVGKLPGSDETFLGSVTLHAEGEQLVGERRIAGRTLPVSGSIQTALCCEGVRLLQVRFEDEGRSFEATYMYQSDLDNYPRLTGYVVERGKETDWPGIETLFPDFRSSPPSD